MNRRQSLCLWLLLCVTNTSNALELVVLADMPYSYKETRMLSAPNGQLYKAIQQANPELLYMLGDIKGGGEACDNELLEKNKALLHAIGQQKMLYTPGDNEWTDCDRRLGPAYSEVERLSYLKSLMYRTPPYTDAKLTPLQYQKAQTENRLFIKDRIALATVHITGTNNGRSQILKDPVASTLHAVEIRDQHNLDWLEFISHRTADFDVLLIGFQADIYMHRDHYGTPCTDTKKQDCDGYMGYRNAFQKLAEQIKKPTLVMHGDTGDSCLERRSPYLWRLNAAGDKRYLDAIRLTVNATHAEHPFHAQGLLNKDIPHDHCEIED